MSMQDPSSQPVLFIRPRPDGLAPSSGQALEAARAQACGPDPSRAVEDAAKAFCLDVVDTSCWVLEVAAEILGRMLEPLDDHDDYRLELLLWQMLVTGMQYSRRHLVERAGRDELR